MTRVNNTAITGLPILFFFLGLHSSRGGVQTKEADRLGVFCLFVCVKMVCRVHSPCGGVKTKEADRLDVCLFV